MPRISSGYKAYVESGKQEKDIKLGKISTPKTQEKFVEPLFTISKKTNKAYFEEYEWKQALKKKSEYQSERISSGYKAYVESGKYFEDAAKGKISISPEVKRRNVKIYQKANKGMFPELSGELASKQNYVYKKNVHEELDFGNEEYKFEIPEIEIDIPEITFPSLSSLLPEIDLSNVGKYALIIGAGIVGLFLLTRRKG